MKKKDGAVTDLQQALQVGLHGVPEVKRLEKRKYLGSFRERVIKALTLSQLKQFSKCVHPEIELAMQHPAAKRLLIRSDVIIVASAYLRKAQAKGLSFKTVFRDDLLGEIVLLVVADKAVKVEDIFIQEKSDHNKA